MGNNETVSISLAPKQYSDRVIRNLSSDFSVHGNLILLVLNSVTCSASVLYTGIPLSRLWFSDAIFWSADWRL